VRFEEVPVADAVGAILAHGHRTGPAAMLKKGHLLGVADARALQAAGVETVWAVRLEPTDRHEDEAARRVASALTGRAPAHLRVDAAATGRVNVFAATRGLFVGARARIDAVNAVDEAITLATVPPYAVVEAGVMVATVKIIPFAVPESAVARACAAAIAADEAAPLLAVAPFVPRRVGLVLTTLPGVHNTTLDRASKNQRLRLASLGSKITRELRVRHDATAVTRAVESLIAPNVDMILVLGASAIIDRRDVVPRAVAAVGGVVDQLGMPVDPGNLILVGHVERDERRIPIVGVPGCARSLKPSGFDWVLERLVAGLPVGRRELSALGAGGLLVDIPTRPSPRATHEASTDGGATAAAPSARSPKVAAIVLAAGLSRRMGGPNKLLAQVDGQPIVQRVVDTVLASRARPVTVVVGHQEDEVRAALAGRDVRFVTNRGYREGLGSSLRTGIEALSRSDDAVDGTLVALGDMPWIKAAHIDALIHAFDPDAAASICVPVHDRKRGHPVLWSSRHFGEMRKLAGDVGARALLEAHADAVLAVPVDDPAVHLDIDTPEMLADAQAGGVT
jgi:molybdenum cofactor cytidylyltransferase